MVSGVGNPPSNTYGSVGWVGVDMLPPLGPTGAHSLDDQSALRSKDGTRQYPRDGPLLSCKQQVGGSSPPASSQNGRSQACRTCLACRMSFRRARYSADGARGVLVEAPAGCT